MSVYSIYEHGGNNKEVSPTLDDYNMLQLRMESDYIIRESLGVSFYHTKEEHC